LLTGLRLAPEREGFAAEALFFVIGSV